MSLVAAVALSAAIAGGAQAAPPAGCPVQPMPPAIDAVPVPAPAQTVIAFAATPWEYPGRAWVVRLSRRGTSAAGTVEIVRMRRQADCNRYEVEQRWQAPLPRAEFDALAATIQPLARPPTAVYSGETMASTDELVLDGTQIELRLQRGNWEVRRQSNHYAGAGARISALFRRLVATYVPASELPAEDWRTRQGK